MNTTKIKLSAKVFSLYLLIAFCFCAQTSFAQQPDETALGIELYNKGEYEKTVEVLQKKVDKKPVDYTALRYLGLAYYQLEMYFMAIRTFDKLTDEHMKSPELVSKYAYASLFTNEPINAARYANKAMDSGVKTVEMYYVLCESNFQQSEYERALTNCDEAIKLDSTYAFAYLTKSMILLNQKRESESADYLEKFLQLRPNDEDAEVWREQILVLRNGLKKTNTVSTKTEQNTDSESQDVFTVTGVTQKATLTTKPQTKYTERARKAGHSGLVRVRAVLSGDGSIRYVLVIRPLRFGLTTIVFDAAKRIQFKPAIKDGKPVSQYVTLEYNFRIY